VSDTLQKLLRDPPPPFTDIVAAQLSFVPGPDGKASAVVLHQNGKDQTAPRVDLSVAQALDVKLAEQSAPRTAASKVAATRASG